MICEPGEKCSDCPYFREVETDYDIEIRCAKYDYESHNKKDEKTYKEIVDEIIESMKIIVELELDNPYELTPKEIKKDICMSKDQIEWNHDYKIKNVEMI